MAINFNPNIAFKNQSQQVQPQPVSQPQSVKSAEPDTFQKSHSFKEDIGKVAKFFTTLSEMSKATVKAISYGAATTGVFLAGGWMFGALPRGFRKGNSLKRVFTHPIKSISTKAKVLTTVAAVGAAGYQIIKGKLKTNQRTANVDHQLNIGHRTNS